MCTAISLVTKDRYFGRNLDIDRSYGEKICVMPRRFSMPFRCVGSFAEHYAIIGMATVADGMPLFYDGANEYGLSMAGLNFPDNAHYFGIAEGRDNVAPFEFIPFVLGKCKNINEVKALLCNINLVDIAFNGKLENAPLHWIISDGANSVTVESMHDGLHIYDNKAGILTNNPPFEYQLENLEKYRHLRADNYGIPTDGSLPYSTYCEGLGAVGLPGDVSSMSRFVRMNFNIENSVCEDGEEASISRFFHLLSSVEMLCGACITADNSNDITLYSSCINTDKGLYYYTTYSNRRISCVDMHHTDIAGEHLSLFSLNTVQSIEYQN